MKTFKYALVFVSSMISTPALAANLTQEALNAQMSNCYHQTLKLEQKKLPDKLTTKHCTAVINNDWTPRKVKAAALLNRGLIKSYQGNTDRALKDFEKATRLDSDLSQPHIAAAQLYYQKDMLKEALHHYNSAIKKGAKDDILVKNRQQVEARLKRHMELARLQN